MSSRAIPHLLLLLLAGLAISGIAKAGPGVPIKATYVIAADQYPAALKKYKLKALYLLYAGNNGSGPASKTKMRGDTILNLQRFLDSSRETIDYRLVFGTGNRTDSIWQLNRDLQLKDKIYPEGEGIWHIAVYDPAGNKTEDFLFNYRRKYQTENREVPEMDYLLRQYALYYRSDKTKYGVASAWVLSIGINEYKGLSPWDNCEPDAIAYNQFFKNQYVRMNSSLTGYHEYLLTGRAATKTAILDALKDIAVKSAPGDYFVLNFSGFSQLMSFDSINFQTYFFTYDSAAFPKEFTGQGTALKTDAQIQHRAITLKALQEQIQLIQARNQLIITEAGPSEKFKTEFIKTMMQHSPKIASLLNVNRVFMIPNKIGLDHFTCSGTRQEMGPIRYCTMQLDSTRNIFDLFSEGGKSRWTATAFAAPLSACDVFKNDPYFEVFFERKFLQEYQEIFGDAEMTRGGGTVSRVPQNNPAMKGNRYALVIGTDLYKGAGWDKLNNPVYDATEIAGLLQDLYGYSTQLLTNPPKDSVYAALLSYYKQMSADDQLVIYIAGHGDYDKGLLDDGFIVCADSKSVEADPLRETYIPYSRFQKMINKLPAKKVLVMLDVCYGGIFDVNVKRDNPASAIRNRNVLEFLHSNAPYTVRKMLSSVGSEPAFDGKAGKHSPFASYLISVLNGRGGQEGIITLADIYVLLQKASLNETATLKISPHMADFGEGNALGEFVLIPVELKK